METAFLLSRRYLVCSFRNKSRVDFHIGDDSIDKPGYSMKYPIRHGIVEDWDLMVLFVTGDWPDVY